MIITYWCQFIMYHYYRSIVIGQTLALHIIQFYCHIVVLE